MANVRGPLMSTQATGTVARILTFKKGVRGYVARKYAKPSGWPSDKQKAIRLQTRNLMKKWKTLSTSDKASWLLRAIEENVEPINSYLKFNFEWIAQGNTETNIYPPAPPNPIPDFIVTVYATPISPDLSGEYFKDATCNGQPTYKRTSPVLAFIWFDGDDWFISALAINDYTWSFICNGNGPKGMYDQFEGSTGGLQVS